MNSKTKRVVLSSMFAAIICIATMVFKIPLPLKGYINLGDAAIIAASWCLPCWYGVAAAAIGSSLADILSGYAVYAPATFVIKAVMSLVLSLASIKTTKNAKKLLSALAAEAIMVLGYFGFEGVLYGLVVAAPNIIPNMIQGIASIVIGIFVWKIYEKNIKKGING